jgi:hypothetical protein
MNNEVLNKKNSEKQAPDKSEIREFFVKLNSLLVRLNDPNNQIKHGN